MALFRSDSDPDPTTPPAPMAKTPVNPAEQHNIIGKGTVIDGTLRSNGNVHVSGTVQGNVDVQGRVVVMPEGRVEGEVVTTSAEVGGRIQGQLTVKERLVLKNTAVVEGDIHTSKLVIEDGATFTGRCDMGAAGGAPPSRAPRPEASSEPSSGSPSDGGRPTRRLGGSPGEGSDKSGS